MLHIKQPLRFNSSFILWMLGSTGLVALLISACASAPPSSARAADEAAGLAAQISARSSDIIVDSRAVERAPKKPKVELKPALNDAAAGVQRAVEDAGGRVAGWWEPLAEQPNYQTLLDPERRFEGSLSLGSVANGKLLNAARLAVEGEYHSVIERHRRRNTQYATEAMLTLIQDAARAVLEESPGPKLRLGNMSVHGGGKMAWSRSHHSGRDADLAFFCRDTRQDKPVPAPDLLRFDADARAIDQPHLEFDTERNWLLVKALLSHPSVGVQWIFVSNPLKARLLAHAEERGEEAALVERAAEVLHQPTDAAPHNDHFHLRITCPVADRLEGCLDFGPRWQWVDWHDDALKARSLEVARAFDSPDKSLRLSAMEFLERIRSPFAPALVLGAARREADPELRRRALKIAADIPAGSAAAVVQALQFVRDDAFQLDEKRLGYRILRRSVDSLALEPLKARVADQALSAEERRLAARALGHFMEPELVPFLLEQLYHQPAEVSAELARLLRRVTNHTQGFDWGELPADAEAAENARADALAGWQKWWKENQGFEREQWLKDGFKAQGFSAQTGPNDPNDPPSAAYIDALIASLKGAPEYIAYNANRELSRVTGRWSPLEAWDYPRLYTYWSRWWTWSQANEPVPLALLDR